MVDRSFPVAGYVVDNPMHPAYAAPVGRSQRSVEEMTSRAPRRSNATLVWLGAFVLAVVLVFQQFEIWRLQDQLGQGLFGTAGIPQRMASAESRLNTLEARLNAVERTSDMAYSKASAAEKASHDNGFWGIVNRAAEMASSIKITGL